LFNYTGLETDLTRFTAHNKRDVMLKQRLIDVWHVCSAAEHH